MIYKTLGTSVAFLQFNVPYLPWLIWIITILDLCVMTVRGLVYKTLVYSM